MESNSKDSIAIFTSAKRGLAHYAMQQWPYLLEKTKPIYITFDREDVDNLVQSVIKSKNIKKLIDFSEQSSSILNIYNYCKKKKVKAALFQVSDRMRNNVLYFTSLIGILKTLHIKVGFILHEVLPYEVEFVGIDDLYLLYKLSDEFFVANENERYKLQSYFNRSKNYIHIIRHGVYSMFDKHRYDNVAAKKKLNISDKKMILFFGQIRAHKKLSLLIDAVNRLKKMRNDYILYIVSDLHLSSPKITQYLKEAKQKLGNRIRIVSRYLSSDNIELYFKAADVVVLPYERVVQSGVLFLAVGFKRPFIITKSFYEADAVLGKKIGYVSKDNTSEELAILVNNVLNNPNEAEKQSDKAFRYYSELNYWKQGADKIIYHLLKNPLKNE